MSFSILPILWLRSQADDNRYRGKSQLCPLCSKQKARRITTAQLHESARCPMCRMILHVIYKRWNTISSYDLKRNRTFCERDVEIDLDENKNRIRISIGDHLLGFIGTEVRKIDMFKDIPADILPQLLRLQHGKHTGPSKVKRLAVADLLRFWLWQCSQKHRGTCEGHLEGPAQEARSSVQLLIDVDASCIVAAPQTCRYTALSYVWGTVPSFELTKANFAAACQKGSISKLKREIPQVIRDALYLTKRIGLKYLWVDQLCIIQDDPEQKHAQICAMGKIYGEALLTIIALSSGDARDGLPRIRRKASQTMVSTVSGADFTAVRLLKATLAETILNHRYETRGWTFQERILSSRCVLFTKEQMYFQCQLAAMSEDDPLGLTSEEDHFEELLNPLRLTGLTLTPEQRHSSRKSLESLSSRKILTMYQKLVLTYTGRKLMDSSDILNAFAGVTEVLEKGYNMKLHSGLPLSTWDQTIFWIALRRPFRREAAKNPGPPQYFPTWSWAGWLGAVTFLTAGQYSRFKKSRLESAFLEHLGVLHPIERGMSYSAMPRVFTSIGYSVSNPTTRITDILHFVTDAVECTWFEPSILEGCWDLRIPITTLNDKTGGVCGILYSEWRRDWYRDWLRCGWKYIALSEMKAEYATVLLPEAVLPKTATGRKCKHTEDYPIVQRWMPVRKDGSVISPWNISDEEGRRRRFPNNRVINIMLVKFESNIAFRVAIGHIYYDAWIRAKPEEKTAIHLA